MILGEWQYGAATWLLALGAGLAWAFLVRYSRRRWEDTQWGRHLMAFTLSIALLLSFVWSARVFGDYPGRPLIGLILYGYLLYNMVRRHILLTKAQDDTERPARQARRARGTLRSVSPSSEESTRGSD